MVEDRLVLLNAYRTLHMVIPESSPLSGTLLLELLKLARYVDDKTIETHIKKELQRGSTIMDTSLDHPGKNDISILLGFNSAFSLVKRTFRSQNHALISKLEKPENLGGSAFLKVGGMPRRGDQTPFRIMISSNYMSFRITPAQIAWPKWDGT